MLQLKVGALLQGGKYKIEKVLGQGGFGITYLATQELLDRKVCIKEFFLKEYCERDEATSHVTLGTQGSREMVERFKEKFMKEARTISKLYHSNIVHVIEVFEENNTVYYVMDYIEGSSLQDLIKTKGKLSESVAVDYIRQIADALDYIHKRNLNHLDVKPANIMVSRSDNRVILIDFGISKQYDSAGDQTSSTPIGLSHGYAPVEQYKPGGVSTFSPQTDIYALGATLYKLVTGNTPPQIDEGLPPLPSSLSAPVVEAIKKAMQFRKVDRPGSISEFLKILSSTALDQPEIHVDVIPEDPPIPHPVKDDETKIIDRKQQATRTATSEPSFSTNTKKEEKDDDNYTASWIIFSLVLSMFIFVLIALGINSGSKEAFKIALAAGGLAVGAGVGVAGSQLAGEDKEVTPEAPKEEKVEIIETTTEVVKTSAPVEPAPVEAASVKTAPVAPASVEQASVEAASVEQVVVEQVVVEQVVVEQVVVVDPNTDPTNPEVNNELAANNEGKIDVTPVDPNTNPTNSEVNSELAANNEGKIDVTPVDPVPDPTNSEVNNELVDGSDQGDIKILGLGEVDNSQTVQVDIDNSEMLSGIPFDENCGEVNLNPALDNMQESLAENQGDAVAAEVAEVDNSQTVQVDIDNGDMLSGIPFDENCGEAIAENEIHPIQDSDINMTDLQEHLGVDPTAENFMAYEGEMPDYVNDADISSLA